MQPPPRRLAAALLLAVMASPVDAALWTSLRTSADVSAVQSDTDGQRRETLRQEYTSHLTRSLTPYLDLRASMRYFGFDLQEDPSLSSLSEEIQPSGEVVWRHPHFVLSSSALRRRRTTTVTAGRLTTDESVLSFRTRDQSLPVLSLRYDWQEIADESRQPHRETRDRRFQAGLDYTAGTQTLAYSFARRLSENRISGLDSRQNNHLLRWGNQASPLDTDRFRLTSHYTYNHRSQVDETSAPGGILREIAIPRGLYARDSSPEFGELEEITGLTDGDRQGATDPVVTIGAGNVDQNIGADLGFERPVAGLYISTDRISGVQPQWSVFVSNDNLTWNPWSVGLIVDFNNNFERYELVFEAIETRYVKAVNGGLNEVAEVLVTELEVFERIDSTRRRDSSLQSHQADLRAAYDFTERLDTSLDMSARHDPAQGNVGDRLSLDYALRARYRQSATLRHHLRWEQSLQDFSGDRSNQLDNVSSYALFLDPLSTLSATASINARLVYLDDRRDQESLSSQIEVSGVPTRGLKVSTGIVRNRLNQLTSGRRNDTWTYRTGLDGALTRSLDALLTYSYQATTSRPGDLLRVRRTYGLGFGYRVTRTIYARGSANLIEDGGGTILQEYLLSWNLSTKLSLVAQTYLNANDNDLDTSRYAIHANYDLNRSTKLYASYSLLDFSTASGSRTSSFQQGLRTSF